MGMQYFEMMTDVHVPNRWHLASPINAESEEELDPRIYTTGKAVDQIAPLKISLRRPGEGLDITYADFHMPVVTQAVADVFTVEANNDIQLIPITVEGRQEAYFILNVISVLDCIDPEASEIQWWKPTDGRPDKVGKPRMIVELHIDTTRVHGEQIFRIANWKIVVIVSERIKALLEAMQVKGVKFGAV
jgi:hypothetical protein